MAEVYVARYSPKITGARNCEIKSDLRHIMEGTMPTTMRLTPLNSQRLALNGEVHHEPKVEIKKSEIWEPPSTEEKRTNSLPEAIFPERKPGFDEAVGLLRVFIPCKRHLWLDEAYLVQCLSDLPYPLNDPAFVRKYVMPLFLDNSRQSGEAGFDAVIGCEELAQRIVGMVVSVDNNFDQLQKWVDDKVWLAGVIPPRKERPAVLTLAQLISNLEELEEATTSEVLSGKGNKKGSKAKAKAKPEPEPEPEPITYKRPSDFTRVRKALKVLRKAYGETLSGLLKRDNREFCNHLRFRRALALARAEKRVEEMTMEIMAAPLPTATQETSRKRKAAEIESEDDEGFDENEEAHQKAAEPEPKRPGSEGSEGNKGLVGVLMMNKGWAMFAK